jgi:hypothetical protein
MYDRDMDRIRILTAIRLASVVLVIAAIVAAAAALVSEGRFDSTRFFAYFTIQSNLIGVAAFLWLLADRGRDRSPGLERLRGAAVVYLTVTFFVVIFLLSGEDVQLDLAWVDVVLHKIFPIVVALDWLLDPPRIRLTYRDALLWLVYPIAWVVLTLIRGAADGWYPYPFLDPVNGGYGMVAIVVIAITLGFLGLAAITVAIGNRAGGRSATPVHRGV